MPDSKAKLGTQIIAGLREEARQEAQAVVNEELGIKPKTFAAKFLPQSRGLGRAKTDKLLGLTAWKATYESGSITGITNVLSEIIQILRAQNKILKKEEDTETKKAEALRRTKREEALEGVKGIVSSVKQVVQPLRSIWERLFKFLKFTFLGKILTDLVKFFTNYKKNKDKIDIIGRFLKDWGPLLATLGAIFFTPLGLFMTGILGILKVAVPAMIALLTGNPKLAAAALLTGSVLTLLKRSQKGASQILEDRGLGDASNKDQAEELSKPFNLLEMFTRMINPSAFEEPTQEFATGGIVRGPGGIDNVPAKLTAGEFVMSKGAVNKWGASTLASMNAAGGGTNSPTMKSGKVHAEGGGLIDRRNLFGKDNWMESRESAGGTSQWLPSRITKDNFWKSIDEHVTQRMQGSSLEVTVRSGSETENDNIIRALDKMGAIDIGPPVSRTQGKTTVLPQIDARSGEPAYDSGSKLPAFTIIDSNHYRENVVRSLGIHDLMGIT